MNRGDIFRRGVAVELNLEALEAAAADQQDLLTDQLLEARVSFVFRHHRENNFVGFDPELLGDTGTGLELPLIEREGPELLLGNDPASPDGWVFEAGFGEEITELGAEGAVAEFEVEDTATVGLGRERQFVEAFEILGQAIGDGGWVVEQVKVRD